MKKIITIMVAVAVTSLAAIAQPYPTTDNIIRLTDQNMPAVEYFTLEKIRLPEKYADAQYFVYNDSVLIIINNQRPLPFVVTFYNLNTKKIIAGFFKTRPTKFSLTDSEEFTISSSSDTLSVGKPL